MSRRCFFVYSATSQRKRLCEFIKRDGQACRSAPLHGSTLCLFHDPASADFAARARKLGGEHRRKEAVITVGHDLGSLGDVTGIRRILDIVAIRALARDTGTQGDRVLISIAVAAIRLIEVENSLRAEALARTIYARDAIREATDDPRADEERKDRADDSSLLDRSEP